MELSDWYHVSFDDVHVRRRVEPPAREPWGDELRWADIERVCFKTGDLFERDEIYIFTRQRPESYLVPTEASGGRELLDEIVRRKLFDAELLIKALQTTNELFCCPQPDAENESRPAGATATDG